MRILVVGNLYPPVVFGGYEILCEQVVELFKGWGHEVQVVTSRHGRERAPECPRVERILHLTTDFPAPGENVGRVDFHPASLARVARLNRALLQPVLQRFRPDIVFCWCLNRLGLGAVRAAHLQGVPCCYTLNDEHPCQYRPSPGTGWKARLKRLLERWLWPDSTLASFAPFPVTAISYALRDRLLEMQVPLGHARVIHQGIPLDRFPYLPLRRGQDQPLRVLYVGQLSRTKGVHTLVRALQRPELSQHCQLTIVGDGVPDYQQELARLAEGLPQVHFAGRLPHQAVREAYQQHHVLVFPSEWEEPFGLTHLEAMASGCAVCSTTTGGSRELIRDGHNALAFEAGNAEHLGQRLLELSRDESLRQGLAERGRRWVEAHHSLEGYAAKLLSFLEACVP